MAGIPGPSSLLTSYAPDVVSPSSPHARKLLTRLDKLEIIHLALSWLCSSSPSHTPPKLSRRPARSNKRDDWAAIDLSEERKARSLADCIEIWNGPMRDLRTPKVRAIDRILTVDWEEGMSFSMLAETELAYLKSRRTSRTWIAAKLEYAPDRDPCPTASAAAIRDLYSQELRHYFAHYLHLSQPQASKPDTPPRSVSPPPGANDAAAGGRPTSSRAPYRAAPPASKTSEETDWTASFTCLRLTLAPTSAELCASGFYILHIPRTPWLLISGSPGRGTENRTIALAAFAQALGARHVNISIPPSQFDLAASEDSANVGDAPDAADFAQRKEKNLAELKGRDPVSLRAILARDALPEGGKGLDMVNGYVEDGPLVDATRRRRETDAVNAYGRLLSPPPGVEDPQGEATRPIAADAPLIEHVGQKRTSAKEREEKRFKRRREAKEMFGSQADETLPVVPRIDFELRLPFPHVKPYKHPSMRLLTAEPIRIRLEGSHVQAGLRRLVLAGLDERKMNWLTDEEAAHGREITSGLPSWITQIKGSNVVVGMARSSKPAQAAPEDGDETQPGGNPSQVEDSTAQEEAQASAAAAAHAVAVAEAAAQAEAEADEALEPTPEPAAPADTVAMVSPARSQLRTAPQPGTGSASKRSTRSAVNSPRASLAEQSPSLRRGLRRSNASRAVDQAQPE